MHSGPGGVLVVEDDEGMLALLAAAFRRAGFYVRTAADGESALRALRDRPPAAVVTDLILPDADGMETVRAMRTENPKAPLVVISGGGLFDATDLLGVARALGANGALAKPFAMGEVVAMVSNLLSPQVAELAA